MTVMTMSAGEISRFDTLMRIQRGELRVMDAMALLGLARSQVFKLLARLRDEGPPGLISRERGRPSNRHYSDAFRAEVVRLVRDNYADFGPTLAREYLAERHGLGLSCETLRQIMMQAGLWKVRAARRPRPYQPRYRRDCRSELVQVNGSKHWWFEDRGPPRDPARRRGPALSSLRQDAPGGPGTGSGQQAPLRGAGARTRHQQVQPHHAKRNNNEPARTTQPSGMFKAPSPVPPGAKLDRRTLGNQRLKRGPRLSNDELVARGLGEYVRQQTG